MKLKKLGLVLFIVVVFLGSMFYINTKYDRYYRIPGITNENRILIEEYLTDDEKKQLIDECIDVKYFIGYIKQPHFQLQNYMYYNQISNYNSFDSMDDMLLTVNDMIEHMSSNSSIKIDETFSKAVQGNVIYDYEANADIFNFEYIDLYIKAKACEDDEQYIADVNSVMTDLLDCGYDETQSYNLAMEMMESYTLDTLNEVVLYKKNHPDCTLVPDPSDLLATLDEHDYLGNYEPKSIIQLDSSKSALLRWFMYLNEDAYNAYCEMLNDYYKEYDEQLIIVDGYMSQEELLANNTYVSEMQLGNTVHLKVYGYMDSEFETTNAKKWLDENCYKYGYILRYPEDTSAHEKESYTYRYVGVENATKMHDENMTLEQFIAADNE